MCVVRDLSGGGGLSLHLTASRRALGCTFQRGKKHFLWSLSFVGRPRFIVAVMWQIEVGVSSGEGRERCEPARS